MEWYEETYRFLMQSTTRMIEKIRSLTSCVSPGDGRHIVLRKGMKKYTGINAEYYMNDSKGRNTYQLC